MVACHYLTLVLQTCFALLHEDAYSLIAQSPKDSVLGEDQIASKMLKNNCQIYLPSTFIYFQLLSEFESSLKTGKTHLVIPIPKSSSSYSPSWSPSKFSLSLTSKLPERFVFNYISQICSSNKILTNSQFGFSPGFSIVLLLALHSCFSSLDCGKSV